MDTNDAKALMDFIDRSPTSYHVIDNARLMLTNAGFRQLRMSEPFHLIPEGRYFTVHASGSALFAWQMSISAYSEGFKLIGSHSDSPCLKIKPCPEMAVQNYFLKLNTEVYGGPILSTWFDRPLSLAGRVILKSDNILQPQVQLINFEKNILIIPNIAIHMNKTVNDGYKIEKQKDLQPILTVVSEHFEKEGFLLELIAQKLSVQVDRILDFDLFLYDRQKGLLCGLHDEFFSVGKLDNLGMAYASLDALIRESQPAAYIKGVCIFDNEEVGSQTPQGAGSPFFSDILKRISFSQTDGGGLFEIFQQQLARSFFISADQAHGFHPNYPEKNDCTNIPLINGGPVIKQAASMGYATDGVSASVFKALCSAADVPFQIFVNRSDMQGGSTIGPVTAANLNIKTVDIGNPVLAMHSIRELGGVADQSSIVKVFRQYFMP